MGLGCSHSKLEDDEAVRICKDRKRFIKEAVEHRTSFASAHTAYIQSLRNVSDALGDYIQGDDPHEFSFDTLVSRIDRKVESNFSVNYLMASGSRPIQVEEKPPTSPLRVEVISFGINTPNSPPSPHNSQWDFFWNPFSSLDDYGYGFNNRCGMDDKMRRLRQEEGIPDLEEDESPRFEDHNAKKDCNVGKMDQVQHANETQQRLSIEVSRGHAVGVGVGDTPAFTFYLNQRPTSMAQVIKDLDHQFSTICTAAKQVSGLLEATRAHYTSSNELSTMKMLNPLPLFRSSRFLIISSGGSRDSRFESSSDFSEESCMLSGSHQSTLDRLYTWEKKLYEEVKSGQRVRIAYEKKCLVLKNQDVKGVDFSTLRDLHTQIKVSIHSIESISERIETLRDQELLPQLLELLQGLARMWKVMAECHQIQKRTLDNAKLLLATTPCNRHKNRQHASLPEINSQILAGSALNLVAQLRNWTSCFQAWITSQRSYVLSLTGWLLRCFRCDPDPEKVRLLFTPHPIYEVCIQWSRLLNGLNEKPVLDKLHFFSSGMGAIHARQLREDSTQGRDSSSMELVEADKVEEAAEKFAEVALKVLCHGMSVVVSSLAEFAISSADEHSKLINHPENATSGQHPEQMGV